jgi:hypothetical protein
MSEEVLGSTAPAWEQEEVRNEANPMEQSRMAADLCMGFLNLFSMKRRAM